MKRSSAVAIVGGGWNGLVARAYLLDYGGYGTHLFSADYGQRHVKESVPPK